jgi:hypothetical protein
MKNFDGPQASIMQMMLLLSAEPLRSITEEELF